MTATTANPRIRRFRRLGVLVAIALPALVLTSIHPALAVAPVASDFVATPDSFSPNGDDYQDTTAATYTLDSSAFVTLDVVDSTGGHVRSLAANASQTSGAQSATWNGKDDSSNTVTNDAYSLVLVTANGSGESNTVTADVALNSTLETPWSSKSPFSPNGDTWEDGSNVKFTLNLDADVRVWVTDSTGDTVDTLSDKRRAAGFHVVNWDGKDSSGNFVGAGNYDINVSAANGLGTVARSVTVTAVIPPFNNTLGSPWSSAPSFSPNGDGSKDNSNIKFKLKRKAKVTIWVVDKKGKTIAQLSNKWRTKGFYTVKWNGRKTAIKSAAGKRVKDGSYTIKITALSSRGLNSEKVRVYVDTVAPRLSKVTNLGTVAPFEDGYKDKLKMPFKLSQAGTVTMRLIDPWGRVQYAKSIGHYKKGSNKFWWNGQNQLGVNMPNGRYRFTLSMVDDAGNKGNSATRALYVSSKVGKAKKAYRIGRIVIDISSQTLTVYDTVGLRRFAILISSGLPGTPTIKGNFKAIKKQRILIARSLTVYADYPTYFYPGYAIHGWPKTWSGYGLSGYVGTRRSHGCVRSETPYAKFIQSHSTVGATKIRVQG